MKCFLLRRTWQSTHLLTELLMSLLQKLKAHTRQIVLIMMLRPALRRTHPKSLAHVTQMICQRERRMYLLIIVLSQIALKMGWSRVNGSRRWWIDGELYQHSQAHRSSFKNRIISQEASCLKNVWSVCLFFIKWHWGCIKKLDDESLLPYSGPQHINFQICKTRCSRYSFRKGSLPSKLGQTADKWFFSGLVLCCHNSRLIFDWELE